MASAVCICPEFVAENIKNSQIFNNFFMGTLLQGNNQIILDRDERIKLDYLRSVQNERESFRLYKAWEVMLDVAPQGRILYTSSLSTSDDIRDVIFDIVVNAATTFDKRIIVVDNNNYSAYIAELRRQRIHLLNVNSLSMLEGGRMQRKEISFTEFDYDLSWVIHRLGRKSAKGLSEDDFNDFIRDMLSAKNYEMRDQTREGVSETGKRAGELDLVVEDNGNLFAIIEALILNSIESDNIIKHYKKLLTNYNPLLVKRLFLVSYYTGARFDEWSERYVTFINGLTSESLGLETHQVIESNIIETPFIGLKKIEHHFRYGNEHFSCIHYAVKMAK